MNKNRDKGLVEEVIERLPRASSTPSKKLLKKTGLEYQKTADYLFGEYVESYEKSTGEFLDENEGWEGFMAGLALKHPKSTYYKYRRSLIFTLEETGHKLDCEAQITAEGGNFSKALELAKDADNSWNWSNTVGKCKYPSTPKKRGKSSRRICKKVTEDEYQKLLDDARERGDRMMEFALVIARNLPIRPKELMGISVTEITTDTLKIHSIGAKKRAANDRGIDRSLSLPVSDKLLNAINYMEHYFNKLREETVKSNDKKDPAEAYDIAAREAIKRLQDRVYAASKRLFPKKVKTPRPSLYSFRHMWGTRLKNKSKHKEITARKIAAIMGHRSTNSISCYGHANSKSDGFTSDIPEPSKKTLSLVNKKEARQREESPFLSSN